jgi:hypothetical protein
MGIVTKAIGLLPVLVRVISDVDKRVKAAHAPGSPGGTKITPAEVLEIVAAEVGPLIKGITELFVE